VFELQDLVRISQVSDRGSFSVLVLTSSLHARRAPIGPSRGVPVATPRKPARRMERNDPKYTISRFQSQTKFWRTPKLGNTEPVVELEASGLAGDHYAKHKGQI
jgi:hypothetical protein